jgi:hypothetical protein
MWWPHDERRAMRCHHHLISFTEYVRRLRDSYRLAKDDAAGYTRMSKAAVAAQRAFCSDEVATVRVREMLERVVQSPAAAAL